MITALAAHSPATKIWTYPAFALFFMTPPLQEHACAHIAMPLVQPQDPCAQQTLKEFDWIIEQSDQVQ